MALARLKPLADPKVNSQPTVAAPENYHGIVKDSLVSPDLSLLRYVEGSRYTVNYYKQVLEEHNDLKSHDTGQDRLYQQYERIVGLVLKVDTPISQGSQDLSTGFMTVEGSAYIYASIVPNVGDMFVANVGSGVDGLFTVTETQRTTFSEHSVFAISYTLLKRVSRSDETFLDLEAKVVRTFYYDDKSTFYQSQPLVIEDKYKFLVTLRDYYTHMTEFYFKSFFSKEHATLIVPGQNETITHDPFITDFILSIVDTFDAPEIRRVRRLIVMDDLFFEQPTLLSLIRSRDLRAMGHVNRTMGLLSSSNFSLNPFLSGLRFTGISHVVYPIFADESALGYGDRPLSQVTLLGLSPTSTSKHVYDTLFKTTLINGVETPIIYPVKIEESYILSKGFYDVENLITQSSSVLEILMLDYFHGRALDYKKLWLLIELWPMWPRLEQFYYIPLLIFLAKVAERER